MLLNNDNSNQYTCYLFENVVLVRGFGILKEMKCLISYLYYQKKWF